MTFGRDCSFMNRVLAALMPTFSDGDSLQNLNLCYKLQIQPFECILTVMTPFLKHQLFDFLNQFWVAFDFWTLHVKA